MAEVTINNSPIHSDSILTAVYGETGPNWSRFHTGTDFAPYGSTPARPDLYSVCNGVVVNIIAYDPIIDQKLGNQVVIQDSTTGYYWRYCHMTNPSPLAIGDNVTTSSIVGKMGDTGNAFGVHLHLEYSTTSGWDYDSFLNPSDALGIPNQRGTIVHYNGTIPPEPPLPTGAGKKNKFPWVLYANKLRGRNIRK